MSAPIRPEPVERTVEVGIAFGEPPGEWDTEEITIQVAPGAGEAEVEAAARREVARTHAGDSVAGVWLYWEPEGEEEDDEDEDEDDEDDKDGEQ